MSRFLQKCFQKGHGVNVKEGAVDIYLGKCHAVTKCSTSNPFDAVDALKRSADHTRFSDL